jgi:hypothetical protein
MRSARRYLPGHQEDDWLDRSWNEIGELAERITLDDWQRSLLRSRWLGEAKHYDSLWRRKRVPHSFFGVLVIVAGLATPLLSASMLPSGRWRWLGSSRRWPARWRASSTSGSADVSNAARPPC